jgi:hypothetical protein
MYSAIIAIVLVVGLVAGLILTLRNSAGTGLPSKELLERATRRARELKAKEKSEGDSGD